MSGITFDTGALIALDRDDRRVLTLIKRASERGLRITVPTTALAQAMRSPARQAQLSRFLRHTATDLAVLDASDATATGLLLARTTTADIVDAHVVICARRTGGPIVTSDAEDLKRLDPSQDLIAV